MIHRTLLFLVGLAGLAASAVAEEVPANPYLADSTWPLFHRNNYAQASGPLPAIGAGDALGFTRLDNPEGGTSPWTIVGKPYRDGSQAVYGSVQGGVVKWLIDGERFEQVDYRPLPRGRADFDWYVTALSTGELVTTSIARNTFYVLADTGRDCPRCALRVVRRIEIPKSVGQMTIHFSISYDGHILNLMEGSKIAAISLETGEVVAVHAFGLGDDYGYHNAFAVDERGRIYLTSQQAVTALDWDGERFTQAWQVPYDFRGPGCAEPRRQSRARERFRTIRGRRCTGTGTTATLMGDQDTGLMVVVDGHAPQNNLVGFWRGDIPPGWRGPSGLDPRVAGRIALPLSTPEGEGHTAENSPAVLGSSVFVAQWAGFRPDCSPPRGVQRVDWNARARRFELVWSNPDVHFNGIPTASSVSGLVYGTGRGEGCTYAYRGLDIDSGRLVLDLPLGEDEAYTDQGNQQTIANDGSIIVGVRQGQLRIHREAP